MCRFALAAGGGESCEDFLLDETSEFTAYLEQLLEAQILQTSHIERVLYALEHGEIANPLAFGHNPGPVALVHGKNIDAWLEKHSLDVRRLQAWGKQTVEKRGLTRVQRDEVRAETESPYVNANFILVPKGSFMMGEVGAQVQTIIPYDFESMDTDVTQAMWGKKFGENPAYFSKGEHSVEEMINGRLIKMQPDNPVENITWWSTLVYANLESEARGLKPVYDLSAIEWDSSTSAAAGTWRPASDLEGEKLKINAPGGDVTQAEGFRLPTEEEWEYMLRDLGRSTGEYPHDLEESELKDVAWHIKNADDTTHPVGTTARSLLINGRLIHDLVGNVLKWMWNGNGSNRVLCGGSWGSYPRFLRSARRGGYGPGVRGINIGFRLARTLR